RASAAQMVAATRSPPVMPAAARAAAAAPSSSLTVVETRDGRRVTGLASPTLVSRPPSLVLPDRRAMPLLPVFPPQLGHQLVEIAVHDLVELVQGKIDPVIGDPVLREVVGANLGGPIAGADHR